MAKQTAVQFLVMKYNQWQGVLKDRDIEEAKAIEKEQIIKTYNNAISKMDYFIQPESAEQYYNDTYENNK